MRRHFERAGREHGPEHHHGRGEGRGHDHGRRGEHPGTDRLYAFGPFGGRGGLGGGRGGGMRGPHGRGRGARRGDVRAAIIGLLTERPMHGYEMISELDQRTGGVWRPSPGSVYPTLQLLEDEGLIAGEESEGRKRFTLTDAGREAAGKLDATPWTQYTEEAGSAAHEGRAATMAIMQALGQIGQVGTEEQKQRALEILHETRRKLYGILSE
ncbi:PadR family transcriptional regulator [Longispora urticae]